MIANQPTTVSHEADSVFVKTATNLISAAAIIQSSEYGERKHVTKVRNPFKILYSNGKEKMV